MKFELPKNGKPSDEKAIELLKKLKALADRGVDGEKETAQRMLENQLLKHGITMEDIEKPVLKKRLIDYKKDYERLLFQVIVTVIGRKGLKERGTKTYKQTRWRWMLTDAEFVELDSKWSFYMNLYKKEEENLHMAFAIKHQLWANDSEPSNWEDLTEEQKKQWDDQERMARGLSNVSFAKQIEN